MNSEKDNKRRSEGKHTAGPWEVARDKLGVYIVGQEYVATLAQIWTRGDARTSSEADAIKSANAALIAAAPDLLAACEHSLRNIESQIYMLPIKQHGTVEHQSLESWAQLLRAAIRKATGQ